MCNQCEFLFISGVGCHETGCPNTGKRLHKPIRRSYVGIVADTYRRIAFQSSLTPSRHYYPEYSYVIGPFKTVRAAKWAALNPCNWSTVNDAERLSRRA